MAEKKTASRAEQAVSGAKKKTSSGSASKPSGKKSTPAKNTKYKLVVSINDQRVYVYGLNSFGEYELDDTFICSTGLGDSTPTGIYTTSTEPLNRWQYFQKFKCWAQYSFRITGNIWFHSVLYSARDTSTLRYGSVSALGHKASHGCVRLRVEDAKWIFDNCDEGTIVVVQ